MINHARTLLMNVSGESARPDLPGEEYVPPDYRPKRLPTAIATVRRILFGTDPDRLCLNYRLREYMTLLHSTELDEYVRQLDPRVTYWPPSQREILLGEATNIVTRVSGPGSSRLYVLGDDTPDMRTGRCLQEWQLRVVDADTLQIDRHTRPLSQTDVELTTDGELTQAIQLPGSPISVRLSDPGQQVGAVWTVETRVRPDVGLGDVFTRLRTGIGEPALLSIFGVDNAEPYVTFKNLWRDHTQLPYQLGGLLLATIYRMDEVRRVE